MRPTGRKRRKLNETSQFLNPRSSRNRRFELSGTEELLRQPIFNVAVFLPTQETLSPPEFRRFSPLVSIPTRYPRRGRGRARPAAVWLWRAGSSSQIIHSQLGSWSIGYGLIILA